VEVLDVTKRKRTGRSGAAPAKGGEFEVTPIDSASPVPAYVQVDQDLRQRIQAGKYPDHARLPAEQTLARLYGVSRVTLRQALQRVADAGLLTRRHGVGTIVTRLPEVAMDLRPLAGITQQLRQAGYSPELKILEQDRRTPPEDVAVALRLPRQASAVVIRRLVSAEGYPLALLTSWLPEDSFPGLLERSLSGAEDLWTVMTRDYNQVPASAENILELTPSTAQESELLGVPFDMPLFKLVATISNHHGRPIEHSTSYWTTSRVRLHF
jgi:GntR family transcriptional regulator